VGDGDCGSTLKRGAEALQTAAADTLPLNNPAACLAGVAAALRAMGGTSGALYNIGLTAAAGTLILQSPLPFCGRSHHHHPKHNKDAFHHLVRRGNAVCGETGKKWGCSQNPSLAAGKARQLELAASEGEAQLSAEHWGQTFEAAVAALLRYSGAQPGHRTMLDALVPAQEAFCGALQQGARSIACRAVLPCSRACVHCQRCPASELMSQCPKRC
jgi:hypothetical protein